MSEPTLRSPTLSMADAVSKVAFFRKFHFVCLYNLALCLGAPAGGPKRYAHGDSPHMHGSTSFGFSLRFFWHRSSDIESSAVRSIDNLFFVAFFLRMAHAARRKPGF